MKGEEEVNTIHLVGERIWVGAIGGVATADKNDPNLLDFSRWISFTKETFPGLSNDHVHSITDMDGEVIVGTEQGVFAFDPSDSTWQSLGLEHLIINDLKYFNQKLYAATNAGIYEYQGQTWDQLSTDGLLTSYFNSIDIDGEGTLWVGTAGRGVSVYDDSGWQNHLIDGPPANLFLDMEIDDQGNLWCANEVYGASLFDGVAWTSLSSIPEMGGHRINSVEKDNQDNLWFSSWGGGVIKYDQDTTWTRYTEKNSPLRGIAANPAYVVVNDIAVDEMGNRWFPVWDALDLTRVVCSPTRQETAWVVFYDQDGIKFPFLQKVFAGEGHLYIGFQGTGLLDYNYNWTLENKEDDRVTAVAVISRQGLCNILETLAQISVHLVRGIKN